MMKTLILLQVLCSLGFYNSGNATFDSKFVVLPLFLTPSERPMNNTQWSIQFLSKQGHENGSKVFCPYPGKQPYCNVSLANSSNATLNFNGITGPSQTGKTKDVLVIQTEKKTRVRVFSVLSRDCMTEYPPTPPEYWYTEYVVPIISYKAFICIISEKSTSVTIQLRTGHGKEISRREAVEEEPEQPLYGHAIHNPFDNMDLTATIHLSEYEAYLLVFRDFPALGNATGAYIKSSKPVIVYAGLSDREGELLCSDGHSITVMRCMACHGRYFLLAPFRTLEDAYHTYYVTALYRYTDVEVSNEDFSKYLLIKEVADTHRSTLAKPKLLRIVGRKRIMVTYRITLTTPDTTDSTIIQLVGANGLVSSLVIDHLSQGSDVIIGLTLVARNPEDMEMIVYNGVLNDGTHSWGTTNRNELKSSSFVSMDVQLLDSVQVHAFYSNHSKFELYVMKRMGNAAVAVDNRMVVEPITKCLLTEMHVDDGLDNDCDGRVDEEVDNGQDDDADNMVDEDLSHKLPELGECLEWGSWTCSVTCGTKGNLSRHRSCEKHPSVLLGYNEGPWQTRHRGCDKRHISCVPTCQKGFWSKGCRKACSQRCVNRECDKNTGECSSCVSGYQGPNCAEGCKEGFYGRDCVHLCRTFCPENCDPIDGVCIASDDVFWWTWASGVVIVMGVVPSFVVCFHAYCFYHREPMIWCPPRQLIGP
ncbi:uncharacterized protein LOC101859137 [Aplysia californica]|uniref:Uncharacterized protein LOC101859137 n=1 Tax=Aplysia californica TaxID=6500 RepID=A0ABM0K7J4_APLCA|nr:uncharacterized protein LOC101859137 [Aplysia californica]